MPVMPEIQQFKKSYNGMSEAELLEICHQWVPHDSRHIAARMLLEELRAEKEGTRHGEIRALLADLKKPHWTVTPTFWLALMSAAAAIAACIIAWYAWRQPIAPASMNHATPDAGQSSGSAGGR